MDLVPCGTSLSTRFFSILNTNDNSKLEICVNEIKKNRVRDRCRKGQHPFHIHIYIYPLLENKYNWDFDQILPLVLDWSSNNTGVLTSKGKFFCFWKKSYVYIDNNKFSYH